ncbi:MAG: AIR synthase family protein [Nitrososphaeria archaeon]|nr:AIR synthase family protein [Nitrososphaeria archaeon]
MERKLGKIEKRVLEEVVLKRLGYKRRDVIVPPRYGEDAAAVKVDGRIVVAAMDPITGSGTRIGWLAVHVNANDVAVMGAEPRWLSITILLPEGRLPELEGIMDDVHEACRRLKIALITGHTEITPDISRPIIVGHMMGRLVSRRVITSSGARPGDLLVMSKTAAIEGTAILASDFESELASKIPREVLESSRKLYERISVLDEALKLARRCRVSAMHDPTEGGIVGGAYEMAEASRCSFVIYEERVPVAEETRRICEALGCNPLKLIASGSLLAALPRDQAEVAVSRIPSLTIIGEFRPRRSGNVVIRADGSEEGVKENVLDELWRLIAERGPASGGARG